MDKQAYIDGYNSIASVMQKKASADAIKAVLRKHKGKKGGCKK